ncbi:anti-sigma-D factor RsdA [Kutzneria viridogrisea]
MLGEHGARYGTVVAPGLDEDDPAHEAPVDLAALRADDALLDALGGANPDGHPAVSAHELDSLLLSWRRDVDSEPFGELVSTEAAVTTVLAARQAARRRPRLIGPLAAAAAVLVIAFAGVGMAARDAKPGDALWGITQMLYTDHAHSVEAAVAVQTDLNAARSALSQGRIGDARSALANAQNSLPLVNSEDGKQDLSRDHANLVQQLNTSKTEPTPSVPVQPPAQTSVAGATTTTTTTTTVPTTTTTVPTTPPTSTTHGATSPATPPSTPASGENSSPKGDPPSTDPSPANPGTGSSAAGTQSAHH